MRWTGNRHGVLVAGVLVATALAASPETSAARTVYVTGSNSGLGGNGAGKVAAMTVGANGALSPVAGSPYAAGNGAAGAVITPNGHALYVADASANAISGYAVAANGGLSPLPGPYAAGNGPHGIAVSPDDLHLYVTNTGGDTVSVYGIGANGALTAIPGSPFGAGDGPMGVALTPDGAHLYVTNQNAATISFFAVAADGSLSAAGSAQPTAASPAGISATPDGRRIYVGSSTGAPLTPTGQVSGYAIAADGSLTALPGSPYAAGSGADNVATSADGSHVFAGDEQASGKVASYTIGADGSLAQATGSPFAAAAHARGLAVSSDSRLLFAAGDNGSLLTPSGEASAFGIAADGALVGAQGSPFGTAITGSVDFQGVTVSPNQGPAAAFTVTPGQPGHPTTFDATGSVDADGSIVRYDWSFGDGTSLPDGGPKPTHTYPGFAPYTATLIVTDNEGCSFRVVYTGQTATCNGGARSVAQHVVDLDPPRLTVGGRRIQHLDSTIVVRVSSDEPGEAVGKGKLVIRTTSGGRDRAGEATSGSLHSSRLKPTNVKVQPQTPAVLTFRIPKRLQSAGRSALEAGGKASANLHISVFDTAGNEDSQLTRVQLR